MDQEVMRRNLMILGQTGIVIVATLIILIIVNFFGILPLSKIAPGLFGWLPERHTDIRTVSAASEVPGYKVEVINTKDIIDYLQINEVFSKKIFDSKGVTNFKTNINKVHVIFTNVVQPDNNIKYSSSDEASMSSSSHIQEDILIVRAHLHENIYSNPEFNSNLGKYIQSIFVGAIVNSTHQIRSQKDYQARRDKILAQNKKLFGEKKEFFLVKKN